MQASIDIVQIISYARCFEVTSCKRVCTEHPADDKLINLAIDSDYNIIVTRNINHVFAAVEKRITTKSGKLIIVLNPDTKTKKSLNRRKQALLPLKMT